MNLKEKMSVSILTLIGIFIIGFVLGAALLAGYVELSEQSSIPDEISAPTWIPGKYWKYSFKTPDIEDAISQMVVASEEEDNYLVGVATLQDAQRHAVLNYNPMLGRITIEDLSIYEQGIPQPLFSFPLKKNKEWSFSLFKIEGFSAKVTSIKNVDLPESGNTILVNIKATAPTGEKLIYSYDDSAKWINSLVFEDSSGIPQLEMTLVTHNKGFAGNVYFVRGYDIIGQLYNSPYSETYKSHIEGHPEWGAFDSWIYHFEIKTEDNSGGALIIRDPITPQGGTERSFSSNTYESSLGIIACNSDELSLTITLYGEAYMHLRIAGGIEYVWNV